MRAYLEGEQAYRAGRYAEAFERFQEAVAADSTFGPAAVGLAIVDVHRVTEFPDFATASSFGPSNLRVTPALDSALELGFSYPAGPLTIGHVITLGTTGLTDMNSGSRAVSAIGGASMYSAFGLILGGAR